jgi:hypothetical protein
VYDVIILSLVNLTLALLLARFHYSAERWKQIAKTLYFENRGKRRVSELDLENLFEEKR